MFKSTIPSTWLSLLLYNLYTTVPYFCMVNLLFHGFSLLVQPDSPDSVWSIFLLQDSSSTKPERNGSLHIIWISTTTNKVHVFRSEYSRGTTFHGVQHFTHHVSLFAPHESRYYIGRHESWIHQKMPWVLHIFAILSQHKTSFHPDFSRPNHPKTKPSQFFAKGCLSNFIWLVVSTYPSEKWWSESQLGWWKFPTEWKNQLHVPNHQPD